VKAVGQEPGTARVLLWAGLSAVALALGFALVLAALYLGADALDALGTERRAELQLGLVVYYRVILLKALWPQLAGVALLWPTLRRAGLRPAAAIALGAAAGYAVAGPLLLMRDVAGLPALRMVGGQHLATFVLTTGAVVAVAFAVGRRLGLAGGAAAP